MVSIYCKNNNKKLSVEYGITLRELANNEGIALEYPLLGALVNNKVRSIDCRLHKPAVITFFDITSTYGHDMYCRTLYFLLYKAVKDLYPKAALKVLHSISGGKYCDLENLQEPHLDEVARKLKERMQQLVNQKIPIERIELPTEEALELFRQNELTDKSEIFRNRKRIFTYIHRLDGTINYYYGFLLPSTSYITHFGLEWYENGLLLKLPSRKKPDVISKTYHLPKLFGVYQRHKQWVETLGVPTVNDLNKKIINGEVANVILITEALHEKEWVNIADEIHEQKKKIVLISGPSSSGKTTSCKRLSIQLTLLGYDPVQISVDDFFVEREMTPKDEQGNYDFEALEAVDLKLFNDTLARLLKGEEVECPTFNFALGKKEWKRKTIQMKKNSILVIEGIHCLNPKLTSQIEDIVKYKIFVSALTSISIDKQNPIPTTDNRLIRRIIRDYNYRGYSALETLRRWQSVRNGEERNIFPYQENADVMVNTALICEFGVFKRYAIPILLEVPETEIEYAEATRLLKFLSFFRSIPEEYVPGTSILREFVGGSKFNY
ncbi:MAG: nucleoside kinase [Bacteroidales bacterium]|jgi:uridine kinase|nr:nucleoside kinase [Bacteroidales bacterium]